MSSSTSPCHRSKRVRRGAVRNHYAQLEVFTLKGDTGDLQINGSRLQKIYDNYGISDIDKVALYNEGIINKGHKVKVLGNGDISVKLNIHVDAYSATAKSKIEAAGGTINA